MLAPMDRRTFLSLLGPLAASCAAPPAPPPATARAPGTPTAASTVSPRPLYPELEEISIAELSARQARGELTAQKTVEMYLARIESLDRSGPTLRSVLETNAEALGIAAQLDRERAAGKLRGPLHGIPILVKDNIDTGDRMQTTAGSLALVGSPAPTDAPLVANLRNAGAIILGKTNLSEWANIRDAHSTSAWSGRGGLTKSPYALDRNPSGSSSGSAVATAANLCAAAIGTETDGSIVSPSSIQGIVGLKPTVGAISGKGIIPISHTQDTAGPMARTVTDAALLFGVLADAKRDFTKDLDANALKGKRIGAVRGSGWATKGVTDAYDRALEDLRALGATVIDVKLEHQSDIGDAELEVMLYELKADMASYLATRSAPGFKTLDDLVKFDNDHPEELAWFGQSLFEQAAKKGPLTSPDYQKALATCRRFSRAEGIDAVIAKNRLDAIVAPTGTPAWVTDPVSGDWTAAGSSTVPAVAGYPSITVPCGDVKGLPIGILFFAGPNREAQLLAFAFAYEQKTKHRRPPRYPATIAF